MIGDAYDLRTPEQIDLQYDLAGLGSRCLALIVDLLIQSAVILALGAVFGLGAALLAANFRQVLNNTSSTIFIVGVALAILLIFALTWGYFIFFELTWNGQTPGKRAAGIRVLTTRGEPVTLVHSLVRNLLRLVDALPSGYMVGAISILISGRSQRLGDMAAGTVVVRERHEELPQTLPPLDPQLALPAWIASTFTAEDVALARDFVLRAPTLEAHQRYELGAKIAQAMRARVAAAGQTIPPAVTDEILLAGVAAARA
ncbi:MAG: RDD family protein [Chloroflexota bacterium]